jgi:hypothetical protein
MADEGVGGTEQLAANAGVRDEGPHQQEHRDDAELVAGDGAHRGLADQFQRRCAAAQVGVAGDADQAHRHSDRNAQQHQREQHDETQDGDGVRTHVARPVSWMSSGWKIKR